MSREETQFKPGQSGNPAGKIKGTKNKWTRLTEQLREVMIEQPEQVKRALDAVLYKASRGDLRAIEFLFDRLDGKAIQALNLSVDEKAQMRIILSNGRKAEGAPDDAGNAG